MGGLPREVLVSVFIDAQRRYIGEAIVGIGGGERIDARYRQIVESAFECGASSLLLAHNHPSGNPVPSVADIDFTRAFRVLTRALDLHLDDHLVVTAATIYSIRLGRVL